MSTCPICGTESNIHYGDTPYVMCPNCDLWYQDPMPPKRFQADNEGDDEGNAIGHLMSDQDKEINRNLASNLIATTHARNVLDIGAKYPYLAHCFQEQGCQAWGMDGIKEVPEYSDKLGVPMILGDFEAMPTSEILKQAGETPYDLLTMIHVFEHMYHPAEALRKLHDLLQPGGHLHLRFPDHGVEGFHQHLSENHYAIHPFFWSLPALMELLAQTQDLFMIEATSPLNGGGQRDATLRSIQKAPTIYVGMIVKNEERDLPTCLASIQNVVDGAVIVDTGSTDQTIEAAQKCFHKPLQIFTYTGASRQDEQGDWKLWDFSQARNQFVERIDANPDADYLLWMDADDCLLTPQQIRRMSYLSNYDIFGVQIQTGDIQWTHHRMWKTRQGVRFHGRIHEYPDLANLNGVNISDCIIRHDASPTPGSEDSNQRNLRILKAEYEEHPQDSRTAFYLANTHKDGGRWAEAIQCYQHRIELGEHYRDEWLFSYLYKARCERANNELTAAEQTLLEALSHAPDWSEFWMELSYMAYDQQQWSKAMGYAIEAGSRTPTPTALWREPNKYTDQPKRMCSFCEECTGNLSEALRWAYLAQEVIGQQDSEWAQRIQFLETQLLPPEKVKRLALLRPGALGDILMTLNLIPLLKQKYPQAEVDYFCHPHYGAELGSLMKAAGISRVKNAETLEQVKTDYDKIINLIGYPLQEGYPNTPMRQHLIRYFAQEMGLELGEELPSLQVPTPALKKEWKLPEHYITIQPVAGWSFYKNWPMEYWAQVIAQFPDWKFIQIGAATDPEIEGADHSFMGKPITDSLALLAHARLHMGVDSWTNHALNLTWKTKGKENKKTQGLILWGSTHPVGSGYEHNVNIGMKLDCRPCYKEDPRLSRMPQGVCNHPEGQTYEQPHHACMFGIPVEVVALQLRTLLGQVVLV